MNPEQTSGPEILACVARVAMLGFLLVSMLELGLGLAVKEMLEPLRNARLVVLSLVVNFVVVPLIAVVIARLMRLNPAYAAGLMLLALAPGAPFIPKVVQMAHGHLAFAAALMVMLMVGSVVYLPLVLPHVIAGVEADVWKVGQSLFLYLLLPLFAGLVGQARLNALPSWLRPTLVRISNVCGLVAFVLVLAFNLESVISLFGTGAIFAALLFVGLSAGAGWLLGGGDRAQRMTLCVGTGLRNLAAALVVGAQNFKDPKVNVMVVVAALLSLIALLPTAQVSGHRAAGVTAQTMQQIKRP